MTRAKLWLLRFWLLFTLCWMAIVGRAQQDELCAALLWPTPQERAQRAAILEKNLAIPGQSSEAKDRLITDSERHNAPLPAIACYPTSLSDAAARKTGGHTIDWSVRLPAIILWLAPPAFVLIVGFMLLWVAGAFRHQPEAGSPANDAARSKQDGGGYDLPEGR
jgi:hypothetical protein